MATRAIEPSMCRLRTAVGEAEACPGELCPFWEPGGSVVEGRCVFERLDLDGRSELASWLLAIRTRLEASACR